MPRRIRVEQIHGSLADEMRGAVANPVVLAGSAFVLGLATGLFLKDAVTRVYRRARGAWWHRNYERTATYHENLPESLSRREPPNLGQPRFGGTGALGVSPASVVGTPTEDPDA